MNWRKVVLLVGALCLSSIVSLAQAPSDQTTTPAAQARAANSSARTTSTAPAAPISNVRNNSVPARVDFTNRHAFPFYWRLFTAWKMPEITMDNPLYIERGAERGVIELSMRQVIELSLADNLDIASAAYNRLFAQTDLLRTLSGAAARGVTGAANVSTLFSGAIGAGVGGGGGGGGSGAGSVTGSNVGVNAPGSGSYDPQISAFWGDSHNITPLNSSTLYGTADLISNNSFGGINYTQGFSTGTAIGLNGFASRSYYANSSGLLFNPDIATTLNVGLSQRLLNGFSTISNRRFIIVAQNNQKIADEVFRQKVIETVAAAAQGYWELAKMQRQLEIAHEATQFTQDLLQDTQELVRAGKAPESNLIQVESELTTRRQAEIQADTEYRKQGAQLKLILAPHWTAAVVSARLVTTDPLPSPTAETVMSPATAVRVGLANRPEIAQSRYNIASDQVAAKATRNELLPSLDVFASYDVSALSGLEARCVSGPPPCPAGQSLSPLPGGFGTALRQSFTGNFHDYAVGFSVNFPVFNRTARADQARAELELAQAQVNLRNQENQLAQQVAAAAMDLEGQTQKQQEIERAQQLARETLENERERFRMGATTVFTVIAAQKALLDLQNAEADARAAYGRAKIELAKVVGSVLDDYNVRIADMPKPSRSAAGMGR